MSLYHQPVIGIILRGTGNVELDAAYDFLVSEKAWNECPPLIENDENVSDVLSDIIRFVTLTPNIVFGGGLSADGDKPSLYIKHLTLSMGLSPSFSLDTDYHIGPASLQRESDLALDMIGIIMESTCLSIHTKTILCGVAGKCYIKYGAIDE